MHRICNLFTVNFFFLPKKNNTCSEGKKIKGSGGKCSHCPRIAFAPDSEGSKKKKSG